MTEPRISYLASPYTHKNPDIKKGRATEAAKAAWFLMQMGLTVYAPIASNYYIESVNALQTTYEDWVSIDTFMLENTRNLFVLHLDGWKESKGIYHEIKFLQEQNSKIACFIMFPILPKSSYNFYPKTLQKLSEMVQCQNT